MPATTNTRPSLHQRLLATGEWKRHPSGNGVVRKSASEMSLFKAGVVDAAGFPLHHGNPVWMD